MGKDAGRGVYRGTALVRERKIFIFTELILRRL